jgi:1-acyl-sn-glycerol-3-phosphate acyltransferase
MDLDRTRVRSARLGVSNGLYRFLRLLVHAVNRVFWRVTVEYEGTVPEEGPVILAPVHRSFIDFFVVSEATRRKIFYMAKDSLWESPRLGSLLDAVGAFPVHREGADRLALDRAQAVLERGDVLIVFPEGTRRSGPAVEDLQEGVAFLAARTGAAIVPIGIGGSARVMPSGSRVPRPVRVRLVVGKPISAPERSERGRVPRSQVHALTESLGRELQRLLAVAEERVAERRDSGRGRLPGPSMAAAPATAEAGPDGQEDDEDDRG